jgi:alkylated DNA repair dioxygenase AlkB
MLGRPTKGEHALNMPLHRADRLSRTSFPQSVEQATGTEYNFCLVNFYATGSDSISYHSDDEHFLGPNPAIASFSFLATRDFLMRHKPVKDASSTTERSEKGPQEKPLKFTLKSGTMILMRGPTQRNWLHSIPKRADGGEGRINITFRKGVVPYSTENYYQVRVK